MLQRSWGPPGTGAGPRCSAMCLRRRTRIRTCNPSRRYRRRTRFRFTGQPSRRSSTPDSVVPEPRPRVRQIANPEPQCRLILRRAPLVPARAAEPGQRAAPDDAHPERLLEPPRELPAARRPQTFFSQGFAQHVLVERQIGHQPLEPAILVLELFRIRRSSLTPRWAYFFFQA